MARKTGKNEQIWVAPDASSQAVPALYVKEWEENTSFDAIDWTCFLDENKTYGAGTPDGSGSFSGYTDSATGNSLHGAVNQDARKFYHYIDFANEPTKYTYGTAIFSHTRSSSRDGAQEVSGNWNAASAFLKSW